MSSCIYGQINGHTPGAQVVDAQHRGHDIAREVVEDQNLPYGLARGGENGCVGSGEGIAGVVVVGGLLWRVEIEDALDGGCREKKDRLAVHWEAGACSRTHRPGGRGGRPWWSWC